MSKHRVKPVRLKAAATPRFKMTGFRESPETSRKLRPLFQLHSSAIQSKGCVLEMQSVSGFSSAVGPCTTISFLSIKKLPLFS